MPRKQKEFVLEYVPTRDDWIVAYCPRCGTNSREPIPPPRAKVRCSGCGRKYRLPHASKPRRMALLIQHLLHGKAAGLRSRAELGLRAYGGESEQHLITALRSNPQQAERIMPILGEVGGRHAADALLAELRARELSIRWRAWLWRWVGIACVLLCVRAFGLWGLFSLFLVGGMLSKERYYAYRSSGAGALAAIRDPRAAGTLAMAFRDRLVRPAARSALHELLPLVREQHAPDIHGKERRAIQDLTMQSHDVALALLAMQALTHIGNQQTMHHFIKLTTGRGVHPAVMREARRSIPLLKSSMEIRSQQSTLLRSANAADTEPETLLRAAGAGEESLANLLRAQPPGETLGGESQPQQATDGA